MSIYFLIKKSNKDILQIFESITCGFCLGIGIYEIINIQKKSKNSYILLITGITFLLYLLIEHIIENYRKTKMSWGRPEISSTKRQKFFLLFFNTNENNYKIKKNYKNKNNNVKVEKNKVKLYFDWIMFIFIVTIFIHSYFVGLIFNGIELKTKISITIILLIHKIIILTLIILKFKKLKVNLFIFGIFITLFSIITPLGIITSSLIRQTNMFIVDSIVGGTFLYIGTLHGLYNSVLIQKCCSLKFYLIVFVGFLISFFILY